VVDFEEFKERCQKVPVEEYPNRVVETMPEPMVSVHVSTYQHADFIHDCMEGVLMQETDFLVEIIIGEDESDDGTREICKEYAEQYPERIRLFLHRRENNVAIHGRPTGRFQTVYSHFMARGKYIAICEGDDYWTDPKKLQKQVGFLEENQEYVLSHHDASITNGGGDILESSKLPDENKRDFTRDGLMKGPFILTLSLCYKNVLEGYPAEYFNVLNGDKFLISLIGQHGEGVYQGNIKPAVYREHEGGIWSPNPPVVKMEILKNTLAQLAGYYTDQSSPGISVYYEREHLRMGKSLYYAAVERGQYRKGVRTSRDVTKWLFENKKYKQGISFSIEALRFLIGHLRRRVSSSVQRLMRNRRA
jgi:glycosyltransferase involved in cell wall biosynthesis